MVLLLAQIYYIFYILHSLTNKNSEKKLLIVVLIYLVEHKTSKSLNYLGLSSVTYLHKTQFCLDPNEHLHNLLSVKRYFCLRVVLENVFACFIFGTNFIFKPQLF